MVWIESDGFSRQCGPTFPFARKRHDKGIIIALYQRNASFQSLCEDYQVCVEALTHWNNMDYDESVARRKEYGELIQSLESEIMGCLNEDCL
jgi:hypothetical protein